MNDRRWQFWIDRGGTFTDCIGIHPVDGSRHLAKVLSSDDAPLRGIRSILGLGPDEEIPPCNVRMGTTLATNALLERKGARTALLITKGFGDYLRIGTQSRPDLFALDIQQHEVLYEEVVEVDERVAADGTVLVRPDLEQVKEELLALHSRGIESIALVLLHAYKNSELETSLAAVAERLGFSQVSRSADVACEMGLLARGETTVVDGYLTPVLRSYLQTIRRTLPNSQLHMMQSSGGLVRDTQFRGKNAILSGPAGGVIAYTEIAKDEGFDRAIGFDMGGTSTDVSCFDGSVEYSYETQIDQVNLRTPMMAIHTVAAGGGSICRKTEFRMAVGPQSVGAVPGPICYGDPKATELSITDCNLALGRVVSDRFPFPLVAEPVWHVLTKYANEDGSEPRDLAAGFVDIANEHMASAIREVTLSKGRDLREFALVVLGGAGGQHACGVARKLGIRTLVFDELSGVLSAFGIGLAPITWHGQRDAGRISIAKLDTLEPVFSELETMGMADLLAQGVDPESVSVVRRIDMRYEGTDRAITIELGDDDEWRRFRDAHQALYGFAKEVDVELVTVRMELSGPGQDITRWARTSQSGQKKEGPLRLQRVWCDGAEQEVPVFLREELGSDTDILGPALILEETGTIWLEPGWRARKSERGNRLLVEDTLSLAAVSEEDDRFDPIRLELYNNRFMSIATQMGRTLQSTAVSTNMRERQDYSCAIFDSSGNLVANAPHIPVHLGAMSESIRGLLRLVPMPPVGSAYATNDPSLGGSHLPDITVITPVHNEDGVLVFFAASRGHHADVGGISPGSMPPFSSQLTEEGVVLRALRIVENGVLDEGTLIDAFCAGPYPVRRLADNLSDIRAQLAANQCGVRLVLELLRARGRAAVTAYMQYVQDNAAEQVAAWIRSLQNGEYRFADFLDDGARIAVCLGVDGERLHVDFTGTSSEHSGNLNAPLAVTVSAILYVLRCMIGSQIPLNSGCLRPVTITVPNGCLLNPDPVRAVAAGNVETSQRVVDVLLGSLGLAAASQGTMNNLTFGDDTFGYYETIAGGAGATANAPGASGVHTHMTNTRTTDPEVLESRYPVRLLRFGLRPDSGGAGRHRGGDGIVREFEALSTLQFSILSERRSSQPFGLQGGAPGASGENSVNGEPICAKETILLTAGDRICIETPGGGGFGTPSD